MSFADKIIRSAKHPISIIWCRDIQGRACYYIVSASPAKLDYFEQKSSQHHVSLQALDITILVSGFGHQIFPATIQQVLDRFGYDISELL